jgi:four helix bundle protein
MTTTKNGLGFMRLDVYRVTRELVVRVGALKIADRELRQQATRAAASVLLQLSEGLPLEGQAARRKYFNEAKGSVCEVAAAVDVAAALGVARGDEVAEILVTASRIKQMLWRLSR